MWIAEFGMKKNNENPAGCGVKIQKEFRIPHSEFRIVNGGPCGTRTHDSLLKRQILYLLS
jgi:hypothetical protein